MNAEAYLADTGPLLCFGLIDDGEDLLAEWLESRLYHVIAVEDELQRLAAQDDDMAVREAAALWQHSWLPDPLVPTAKEAEHTAHHQAVLQARSGKTGPKADLGEAQTIAVANVRNYRVMMCDLDAILYADEQHLVVRTPVDVLRMAVADGMSHTQAWEHYEVMDHHSFAGEHLAGQLDLDRGWIDI